MLREPSGIWCPESPGQVRRPATKRAKAGGFGHLVPPNRTCDAARSCRQEAEAVARQSGRLLATIRTVAGDNQDGYLRHRLAA